MHLLQISVLVDVFELIPKKTKCSRNLAYRSLSIFRVHKFSRKKIFAVTCDREN